MATNTLTDKTSGQVIDEGWANDIHLALQGDHVPRNSSGAPEDEAGNLGRADLRWDSVYANSLVLSGQTLDPNLIDVPANRIISGATRTDSLQPDFIRADGTAATATILASAVDLRVVINNLPVTANTDIVKTGLTTAPSTNNTCLINESAWSGQYNTRFAGEENNILPIDNAGSEITDRVGQYICLKATNEYIFGYLKSATELTNCYRGYFFDDAGEPIVREALSDNDTLTLMSLGWVFLSNAGNSVDVSYRSPVYSYATPAASLEVVGNYWYDLDDSKWKRWNGSIWEIVNRTLIGLVVVDGTACVASRSFDSYALRDDLLTFEVEKLTNSTARIRQGRGEVYVYNKKLNFEYSNLQWDMATDLETGLTEQTDLTYYLYITEKGELKISDKRPYNRKDLKGFYHPYHSWRCVGSAVNKSGDFNKVYTSAVGLLEIEDAHGTYIWVKPISYPELKSLQLTLVQAGADYNTNGNHSTFAGKTSDITLNKHDLAIRAYVPGNGFFNIGFVKNGADEYYGQKPVYSDSQGASGSTQQIIRASDLLVENLIVGEKNGTNIYAQDGACIIQYLS